MSEVMQKLIEGLTQGSWPLMAAVGAVMTCIWFTVRCIFRFIAIMLRGWPPYMQKKTKPCCKAVKNIHDEDE